MCFVLNGCPEEQYILVNWTAGRRGFAGPKASCFDWDKAEDLCANPKRTKLEA